MQRPTSDVLERPRPQAERPRAGLSDDDPGPDPLTRAIDAAGYGSGCRVYARTCSTLPLAERASIS